MGINVYANKSVIIDHSHQEMVDTSFDGNPTIGHVGGLNLRYIYRRKTTKGDDRDGNPLVYALKNMNGYHLQAMYRRMLDNRTKEILGKFATALNADMLINVPSSKTLCSEFAGLVSIVSGIPFVQSSFLRKRTVGEVLTEIDTNFPCFKNKRKRDAFISELGRLRRVEGDITFQMKDIRKNARGAFQPFAAQGNIPALEGKKIILIDDLVSSGSSIKSVAECLRNYGCVVEEGICLLSDLRARKA